MAKFKREVYLEERKSAEGGSRTHNPVKEQRPERCVYANFTTSARSQNDRVRKFGVEYASQYSHKYFDCQLQVPLRTGHATAPLSFSSPALTKIKTVGKRNRIHVKLEINPLI